MSRPFIAVTCDRRIPPPSPGPRVRPSRPQVVLSEAIVHHLRAASAIPVLLPPGDPDAVEAILKRVDGVVVTGGAMDIHPRHYGAAVTARLDRVEEDRTELELELLRRCAAERIPTLGICGGMQALAVALGGTLVQDIATQWPSALEHEQPTDPATPWHPLVCDEPWRPLFGPAVNSTHHQAVLEPGALEIIARSPDGVVEAVHLPTHPFCVGVQWHPELLDGRLFEALVSSCR